MLFNPRFKPLNALIFGLTFWLVIGLVVFFAGCRTTYDKPVPLMSAADFSDEVDYDITVVVFEADWCPYCHMIRPSLDTLAKTYAGRIKIVMVNTDKMDPALFGYDIQGIPHIVIRKNGKDIFSGNLEDLDHINRLVASALGEK